MDVINHQDQCTTASRVRIQCRTKRATDQYLVERASGTRRLKSSKPWYCLGQIDNFECIQLTDYPLGRKDRLEHRHEQPVGEVCLRARSDAADDPNTFARYLVLDCIEQRALSNARFARDSQHDRFAREHLLDRRANLSQLWIAPSEEG